MRTTRREAGPRFDVATITDAGARAYQQDTLVANFPAGEEIGIGVLADGMGGHNGGDVASALVVGRAFAELRAGLAAPMPAAPDMGALLAEAVEIANEAVRGRIASDPGLRGMGSTLVACVTVGPALHWVSVGDSPLYLVRGGEMTRLNEDHSMAPQIEAMVASGLMEPEVAADHPERNQLLSAICGRSVDRIDMRAAPYALQTGDVLVAASDGVQTLPDPEICRLVHRHRRGAADDVAHTLMRAVKDVGDPEQDNIAIMAMKVLSDRPAARAEPEIDPLLAAMGAVAAAPEARAAPAHGDGVERADDDLMRAFML